MTRRERMEARLEKRRAWADSRDRKSAAAFAASNRISDNIPLGQPILIGHHSEKHHRRDIERIDSGMRRGVESAHMADHHRSKAGGIEDALDRSIFSDDPDAAEALEAKAASIEAEADRCKAQNAAFRKASGADGPAKLVALVNAGVMTEREALSVARLWAACPYHASSPHPSYHLTNLRANARRLRLRIGDVKRRQERAAKAEAAGGVFIEGTGDYVSISFPEFPGRGIVDALKTAQYHWSGGAWHGKREHIPAPVLAMVEGGAA